MIPNWKVGDKVIITKVGPSSTLKVGSIATIEHIDNDLRTSIPLSVSQGSRLFWAKVEGYKDHLTGWDLIVKPLNIPNNILSRKMYPELVPSDCGKYLIKDVK